MWEGEVLKALLLRHRFDIVKHTTDSGVARSNVDSPHWS